MDIHYYTFVILHFARMEAAARAYMEKFGEFSYGRLSLHQYGDEEQQMITTATHTLGWYISGSIKKFVEIPGHVDFDTFEKRREFITDLEKEFEKCIAIFEELAFLNELQMQHLNACKNHLVDLHNAIVDNM